MDEITQKLNQMSMSIKNAEQRLKSIWFDVEHGQLKWTRNEYGRYRVMCGERAFIECKVGVKIDAFKDLQKLIEKAESTANERLQDITVDDDYESVGNK